MKKYTLKPAEQRVVLLEDESKEQRTAGGIIIPSGAESAKPFYGTVVAVGKGSKDHPMEYQVGQHIIMSDYAGLEVKLNLQGHGEHIYKIVNQLDIMSKIQEVKE